MKQANEIIEIELPNWNDYLSPKFVDMMECEDRYIINWGSRGSGKSVAVAMKILNNLLTHEHYKLVLVRKTLKSIEESSYKALEETADYLGIKDLFTFTKSPLKIRCNINNNYVIARGSEDPQSLKSLSEITSVFYEEDIPSLEDFITISTSLRTKRAKYIQEIFCINPYIENTNFEDHWFYKRFFADNYPAQLSFKQTKEVQLTKNKTVRFTANIIHSTFADNKNLTDEYQAILANLKTDEPHKYVVYYQGLWHNKQANGVFYKDFDRAKNVVTGIEYNPELPIYLSVDFNVNPGMHGLVLQMPNPLTLNVVDEIFTPSPRNTTKGLCLEFIKQYPAHYAGLYVMGDCNGRNRSTSSDEAGYNDYKRIEDELKHYRPVLRVPKMNPSVVSRGNFINKVFLEGFKGISINISDKCTILLQDMTFLKEDTDGSKKKQKVTEDGVTWEKYGHTSDCLDYAIIEIFKNEYHNYQKGDIPINRMFGNDPFNYNNNF